MNEMCSIGVGMWERERERKKLEWTLVCSLLMVLFLVVDFFLRFFLGGGERGIWDTFGVHFAGYGEGLACLV